MGYDIRGLLIEAAAVILLAVFLSSCGGASSWRQRDCYENGPCVVKTTLVDVQKNCWRQGMLDDQGRAMTASKIAACYDKAGTIWLAWDDLNAIFHELCHYFCSPTKTTLCDVHCDRHNEDGEATIQAYDDMVRRWRLGH